MRYYDYLQLGIWQELSDEKKLELFDDALKPMLETRHELSRVYLVDLAMGDVTCRTIGMDFAGQTFYFMPGQEEVPLGRQAAVGDDCLKDQALGYSRQRQVTIEPMFVAKDAKPVGVTFKGTYNVVTGEYRGNDQGFYELNKKRIQHELFPQLSFEESLVWQFPSCVLARNIFFMEQDERNSDQYTLYSYQDTSYGDVWLEVYSDGFQLLSEDAWEYVFAPKVMEPRASLTPERVILQSGQSEELIPKVCINPGMNPDKCELLAETGLFKPVACLGADGQGKSVTELAQRVTTDIPRSNAALSPDRFNYRAAIVFSIK